MGRQPVLQDYGNIQMPESDNSYQIEAMRNMQRDKELKAEQGYQKGKDAEADKYRKLKMIDDATDLKEYQSSTQKANSLAAQQILGIRNEYAGKTGLPIDQLYMELHRKITPVSQGYESYKNDLTEQESMAKEVVKVNPNIDLQKILADTQVGVDNHHLTKDKNGNILGFNQATIGTPSNSLEAILKPENAWKYSKGTKPLIDAVTGKGQDGELFQKAPDGSQINYKTKIPKWGQLVDDKGEPLKVDPKSQYIPTGVTPRLALKGTSQDYQESDENGKPLVDRNGKPIMGRMTVVSKETMKDILSNDELEYAFEGDWQKHKQMANAEVDPSHEEDLKTVYFSKWLADNGLYQPAVSAITHLPPQPRTTNNIRVGGAKEVPVMDIVTPVTDYFAANPNTGVRYTGKDGKDKTVLYSYAPLNVFNNEVTDPIVSKAKERGYEASNIYYANRDGKAWVMGTVAPNKVNPETDVALFKLDKFSNVSGNKPQGASSKKEALKQAQSGGVESNPTAPKKEIKRSDIAGKAAAAGYTVKEYEALLKQKGVSIKD